MKPGNTPLVKLESFSLECSIYAKYEALNPSGSIKDRTVYYMLLDYQNRGVLKEGSTIVEATSGNTGISLAYYAKGFHYQAIIVMPLSASIERRNMISHYGGKVILVDGGMKECHDTALEIIQNTPNSLIFNQFENLTNPKAHYLSTGPEIIRQCQDVDYIFATIGTGGTISGIARYLREKNYPVKVIGIEPSESPLITQGIAHSHLIQGIGANFIPQTYCAKDVDEVITVSGKESIKMMKRIKQETSLDVGISSGACLLGALNYIKSNNIQKKKIVVIFPDKGDRYHD